MKKILDKIINTKNKRAVLFVVLFCFIFGAVFNVNFVLAQQEFFNSASSGVGYAVALLLSWIAYIITSVVGLLITVLIKILVTVANFNNIINVETVKIGWVAIRDICNMFFILALLVIAFGTILRIESYNAKKLLPKLLIMAVLINFSKTIFGLIIDFSQVIMLTFTNAFVNGNGWFIEIFNLKNLLSVSELKKATSGDSALTGWAMTMAVIAGVITSIITLIVIAVILAVLVMRVIMLWVYTILSPLVFLGFALPSIQKYTGKIWEDFIKQVIVGPILAFFIWLALTTLKQSSEVLGSNIALDKTSELCVGGGAFFCNTDFQQYIITIGLLIGGLMVAQQIGGIAGNIAGKGMAWAKKAGAVGALGAKNIGSWGVDKASLGLGVDLNVVRGYKRLTAKMDSNKKERASKIYDKVLSTADGELNEKGNAPGYLRSKLALASTGSLAWQNISGGRDGVKKFFQSNRKRDEKIKEIMGERDNKGEYIPGKEGLIGKEEEKRKGYATKLEKEELDKRKLRHLNKIKSNQDEIDEIEYEVKNSVMGLYTPQQADRKKLLEESSKSHSDKIKKIDDDKRTVDDVKVKEIEEKIIKYKEEAGSFNLKGMHEERALSKGELESEGNKKISNIENPDQLVEVLKEALKDGQQGLVAAITKKLTRQGNYNEFLRALKLGTGRDGMIGFSKKLQQDGGFTRQTALALTGEIGELAKNVKHFAAFGAVKIENGKYTEASQDEADAAQLTEMLKVQLQDFARNTGRLGLGEYEEGKPHTVEYWKPTRAALAMYKLNPGEDGLAKNILQTGQASGALHMSAVIKILEKNNIPPEIIKALTERRGETEGVDYDEFIKEMRNKI